MKIRVGTATEQNKQPEPPERKPNEDRVISAISASEVIVAVMDGIPVLRDQSGAYPQRENGALAAQIAAEEIVEFLERQGLPNADALRWAFNWANEQIKDRNERLNTYKKEPPQWLATVGAALWANEESERNFFGYIDDPLAFLMAPDGTIELITEDQHIPSEGHFWEAHKEEMRAQDPAGNATFRAHQDVHVRNRISAKCWCGELFRGWGALTGEEAAMSFVSVQTILTPPGTRIVITTDAFEAIGAGNAKERRAEDYRDALVATRKMNPQAAAQEMIRLIRMSEQRKRCKSDDAGLAVVDFEN